MSQDLLLALSESRRRGLCAPFPQWNGAGIGGCSRFAFTGGWGQSSEGDLGHYEMFFWAAASGVGWGGGGMACLEADGDGGRLDGEAAPVTFQLPAAPSLQLAKYLANAQLGPEI